MKYYDTFTFTNTLFLLCVLKWECTLLPVRHSFIFSWLDCHYYFFAVEILALFNEKLNKAYYAISKK